MGFFGKIKQGLGLGTVKVELQIPGQVAKDAGQVQGQLALTAQSDQHIKEIKFRFVETYTTGRGDEKKEREYELGTLVLSEPFDMKKDESKTIPFTLPFQIALSSNQSLAEEKGVLGALGKAAVFAKAEKSEYFVKVVVDCAAAALDPSDSKPIHLI